MPFNPPDCFPVFDIRLLSVLVPGHRSSSFCVTAERQTCEPLRRSFLASSESAAYVVDASWCNEHNGDGQLQRNMAAFSLDSVAVDSNHIIVLPS